MVNMLLLALLSISACLAQTPQEVRAIEQAFVDGEWAQYYGRTGANNYNTGYNYGYSPYGYSNYGNYGNNNYYGNYGNYNYNNNYRYPYSYSGYSNYYGKK